MIPKFLQPERVPYASITIVPAPVQACVCSWCGLVLRDGVLPVTHGICPVCAVQLEQDDRHDRDDEAGSRCSRACGYCGRCS